MERFVFILLICLHEYNENSPEIETYEDRILIGEFQKMNT